MEIKHQSNGKKAKFIIPDEFPFVEARDIFLKSDQHPPELLAEVTEGLKWSKPDEGELKDFLIAQKGFNTEKVDKGMQKLVKCIPQIGRTQVRLDNFFKSTGTPTKPAALPAKKPVSAVKGIGFKKKK
jgi:flap endonuclease-1